METQEAKAAKSVEKAKREVGEALAHLEGVCEGALRATDALPGRAWRHDIAASINRARNLTWALRRYPVFDVAALRRAAKQKAAFSIERQVNMTRNERVRESVEVSLWLPVFAVAPVGLGYSAVYIPLTPGPTGPPSGGNAIQMESTVAGCALWTSGEQQRQNQEALAAIGLNWQNAASGTAVIPAVPSDVKSRLDVVSGRFDSVHLAWEAEWSVSVAPLARDPLVLGVIGGTCFLIDQWDVTKIEHYVSREFTEGVAGA